MRSSRRLALALALVPLVPACRTSAPEPEPGPAPYVPGDEIVVCGVGVPIGVPVVLWSDPGGYDAYATTFDEANVPDSIDRDTGRRYTPGRVARDGEVLAAPDATLDELGQVVDQFVVHYDVCGTSRRCFEVLHDLRGLSVHFMIDLDGTVYQTLDCRDQAWHARQANPRSVGVELANIGAYPPADVLTLEEWYAKDRQGWYVAIPRRYGDGGVRTPGFVARPATAGRVAGAIHGKPYVQYDFTPEQYDSLAKLVAGLSRALPRLEIETPRGPERLPLRTALPEDESAGFRGIVGHYHLTTGKIDPGPVFDFEEFLRSVRIERGKMPLGPITAGASAAP